MAFLILTTATVLQRSCMPGCGHGEDLLRRGDDLLRDQLLGKKSGGEVADVVAAKVTCGELLECTEANIKPTTARVWKLVIEATLRPCFGHPRARKLTTEQLREFRRKRPAQGRSDAMANRELSILRTAPKIPMIPYFPMAAETNVCQGFLTDEQYAKLRGALREYLRPLRIERVNASPNHLASSASDEVGCTQPIDFTL